MDLELGGKSVVVTGGASNIGKAIVLGFATEGARITIADLDESLAEQVASLAMQRGATDVQVVRTDITDMKQVRSMFDSALQRFDGVDILVNNVGWDKLMFFTQTDPSLWEKIIQVNFVGMLNCTQCALEYMVSNGGAIVSLSSDASRQGEPREAVYGAMKAGINSFMKTIARENGRFGVRCNVVCPGVTVPAGTESVSAESMWSDREAMFTAEQLEKIAGNLPLKKLGDPNDIANAVMFLASDAAAGYITGQVLSVSGGYSMIG
jgi:NAD(P)-dependent dehydrogenase (short-subunit alcohol dehydrogenase family)